MSLRDSQIAQKKSHGKHGNHGNVFLNTNCRYDTQSTQMGADYAEKVTRKARKSRIFFEHVSHESSESF